MDSIDRQKTLARAEFNRTQHMGRCRVALIAISLMSIFLLIAIAQGNPPLRPENLDLTPLLAWLLDLPPLDTKTMFLICNAILLVIIMESGLIGHLIGPPEIQPASAPIVPESHAQGDDEDEDEDDEDDDDDDDGDDHHHHDNNQDAPEETEQEEDDIEELNRKFEEFIEKVKNDRNLEAPWLISPSN